MRPALLSLTLLSLVPSAAAGSAVHLSPGTGAMSVPDSFESMSSGTGARPVSGSSGDMSSGPGGRPVPGSTGNMSSGTGASIPEQAGPSDPSEGPAETTLARALVAAGAAVRRGKLDGHGPTPLAERALAAGLDAPALVRLLEAAVRACPGPGSCSALASDRAVPRLVEALGELGGVEVAPTLVRLGERGVWEGSTALERVLARAMAAATQRARCAPPDAGAVAVARVGLADFLLVRVRHGEAVGVVPDAAELDDLAYFFAAVADAGPEVGAAVEGNPGTPLRPGVADPERERLAEAMRLAHRDGDLAAVARHGREYLRGLGFPGPLDRAAEDTFAWGGARYSYVLRDLAQAAELLGDASLAGALYRRADPGGGMCGTSTTYRWAHQVRGAIRSSEQLGDCRPAVAERLLDIDGPRDLWPTPRPDAEDYGPARLRLAGFDVPRLYRGALLTAGRELEPAALQRALERAPADRRAAALARLRARGPEAWARRVFAVEGLADASGRAALPQLQGLLAAATPELRARALAAIGELAARPSSDPCDPELAGLSLSGSSGWERHVTPLGATCATSLRLHEAGSLAMSLVPWLEDHDPETRRAAAEALGRIGHRAALPALRARRGDRHAPEGTRVCVDGMCGSYYPVREAVAAAIASIRERSRDDATWRRHDPARPR